MIMAAIFFKSPSAFRTWLEKNHQKKTEIIVGFYKVGTGKPSMIWSEAVDQALCFGWIDGIRRSIDEERYCNRFTPRKATSTWSAINVNKVKELMKRGLMHPAGIAAFEKRSEGRTKVYAHENPPGKLNRKLESKFRANKKAWTNFHAMTKSYQKNAIHWVTSAKKEETTLRRLDVLIEDCEAGRKIKPLS